MSLPCQLTQNAGINSDAWPEYVRQVRQHCQCSICDGRVHDVSYPPLGQPIVCLPLMRIPAKPADTTPKYLPEMWKPNG